MEVVTSGEQESEVGKREERNTNYFFYKFTAIFKF